MDKVLYEIRIPTEEVLTVADLIEGAVPSKMSSAIDKAKEMGSYAAEIHPDALVFGFQDPAKTIEFYIYAKKVFHNVEMVENPVYDGVNIA